MPPFSFGRLWSTEIPACLRSSDSGSSRAIRKRLRRSSFFSASRILCAAETTKGTPRPIVKAVPTGNKQFSNVTKSGRIPCEIGCPQAGNSHCRLDGSSLYFSISIVIDWAFIMARISQPSRDQYKSNYPNFESQCAGYAGGCACCVDRYFLSSRILALREIRALIKPHPERPPPKSRPHYEPPSKGGYRITDSVAHGLVTSAVWRGLEIITIEHHQPCDVDLGQCVSSGSVHLLCKHRPEEQRCGGYLFERHPAAGCLSSVSP